ncbi:endoplasmic reticulum oxidoreductin-1 [Dorcoceras hygrometricum]|uniref:Endoplasmic reticulum oxidoreductin-1 n=1 Tax=Dorcoceras hygrometricum TaxID=472368 RepID=A0A2Z7C8V1_9LAMI|nr:endoplasmic reticulum oxidoreductin-1 [Dorcoceras hygrometricum]
MAEAKAVVDNNEKVKKLMEEKVGKRKWALIGALVVLMVAVSLTLKHSHDHKSCHCSQAALYLEHAEYNTGNLEEDLKAQLLMRQLVYNPNCRLLVHFHLTKLSFGKVKVNLSSSSRSKRASKTSEMSPLGKLQVLGFGTALKILFSVDGENQQNFPVSFIYVVSIYNSFSIQYIHLYLCFRGATAKKRSNCAGNLLHRLSESVKLVQELNPSVEQTVDGVHVTVYFKLVFGKEFESSVLN